MQWKLPLDFSRLSHFFPACLFSRQGPGGTPLKSEGTRRRRGYSYSNSGIILSIFFKADRPIVPTVLAASFIPFALNSHLCFRGFLLMASFRKD